MLRGTRILVGDEASEYVKTINDLRWMVSRYSPFVGGPKFEEIILPAIWESETFDEKVGKENSNMMWRFKDKGERDVCLIPEVTGIIQELWRNDWSKKMSSRNVFYVSRCYRYERPQKGRYREFTQFGIEMLGTQDDTFAKKILKEILNRKFINYEFNDSVKRGLSYYIKDGFEVNVNSLGAQKQIAGGGIYPEGVGWAIGIERLIMSKELKK